MPLTLRCRCEEAFNMAIFRRILVLSAILPLLLPVPRPASAHAILLDSTPPGGGRVAAGKIEFHLRYNSLIDQRRSRLTLTLPDRTTEVIPIERNDQQDRLMAEAQLAPGAYSLRWQVLAVDGHITRGDIGFMVEGN
jgi:copper resistance protein C